MSKVFLIDNQTLLREGLVKLLESHDGFEICGQSATAADAIGQIPTAGPDLVLLDLSLPDKNGLELIKDLRTLCPEIPVLVLSSHDETLYAERALRAGACGYLMKNVSSGRLFDAMRRALAGRVILSSDATDHILGALSDNPVVRPNQPRSCMESLTDREFEVFELLGKGLDVHGIGRQLSISPRTVDAHRARIWKKLGLADSTELLRYAVRWMETGGTLEND